MSEAGKSPPAAARPAEPADERSRDAGWIARLKAALGLASDETFRRDLATALEAPERTATAFSPEERLMLLNILGFRELRIDDVMVPRADIIACDERVRIGELMDIFRTAGHSRIPVYRETLDDPVGMVHIKDLMSWITARARRPRRGNAKADAVKKTDGCALDLARVDVGKPLSSAKIIRPVLFVPPSMPAVDLLVKMQATRIHLALVVDEFGGTDGLVSIEDLVEEIVGDIEDEHDPANAPQIKPTGDGGYIADARLPIEDLRILVGHDLAIAEEDEDVDTIGGLVFSALGRVPVRGEIVAYPGGLEFEVLDADPRRIKKLKFYVARPGQVRRPRLRREPDGPAESGAA